VSTRLHGPPTNQKNTDDFAENAAGTAVALLPLARLVAPSRSQS
jgi:hypothetical protein